MNEFKKKYQIFVSSTYEDLVHHRSAAMEKIRSRHHLYSAMGLFPAEAAHALDVIRREIDESDIDGLESD